MSGRIPIGLLSILTALAFAPIQAQDQYGPPSGYGVQPAGFHAMQDGAGQYHGPPLSYQQSAGPQISGPPPRMVYEQLPDDLGFTDGDTPLGQMLTETFRHSWFRGEYLLWNISGPGNVLLGGQTSTGVPANVTVASSGVVTTLISGNPTGGPANIPINQGVLFTRTVNSITGTSQSPNTDDFSISNLNGFRGTFGVPTQVGDFEFSAFILGKRSTSFDGDSLIQQQLTANPASAVGSPVGINGLPAQNFQPASFISQALLVNGVAQPYSSASANFIDYDVSYHARLTTSTWGTEGNYIPETPDPNSPFQLRPVFGFRYFNFKDRLNQGGQYRQPSAANAAITTVVSREIDSWANNHLFGPQLGMRMEYTQAQFRIGVEPKVMLGLNNWQSNLSTSNVLSSTDPSQNILQRGTTFSPMFDLKLYSNIALSKYVSAYVAYNFLFAGNLNRSYNDVIYNKNSTTNQSAFQLDKTYSNATLQGLSVGFDVRY